MPDDAILLRRFTDARDAYAFAELVHRHLDVVYSAALRRVGGDTHLAEDVTQQVFTDLARRAHALTDHPALTAWLHLATRHAAANTVRTERRRKARERAAFAMPENSSSSAPDWSHLAPLIDAAIDRLGERDRAALLLRLIENRSFAEVGAALQLSEDAARMRVARALEKLRAILARQGIASTASALGLALANHAVAAAPAGLTTAMTSSAFLSTAAAPSGLGFLAAMTSSKSAALLAGAVLIAAFGTATYEIARARTADTALLAAREADSVPAARLRTLEAQAAAAEGEAAALAQRLHDSEAATAGTARDAATVAAKPPTRNPTADGTAFMQRHPAVRQALIDWFDAQTNYRYSAFYESAGLTTEQIAAFQALHRMGAFSRSLGPTTPYLAFELAPPSSWRNADARTSDLLGPDLFQKYREFQQTLPARELGAELASALAFTTSPLSASQFDRFTRAVADAHAVHMTPTGPNYDWTVITQNVTGILAPQQTEALAGLRAKSEFDAEYSRAAQAPVSGTPTTP